MTRPRRTSEPQDKRPIEEQRLAARRGIETFRRGLFPPLTAAEIEASARLGETIYHERLDRDLYRREIPGVAVNTLRNIELGQGRVRRSTIERIVRALDGDEDLLERLVEIAGPAIAPEPGPWVAERAEVMRAFRDGDLAPEACSDCGRWQAVPEFGDESAEVIGWSHYECRQARVPIAEETGDGAE